MFSKTFVNLMMTPFIFIGCQASSRILSPQSAEGETSFSTSKCSFALDGIASVLGLEENIWDACSEAIVALVVFALASVFLKSRRRQKSKIAKSVPESSKHVETLDTSRPKRRDGLISKAQSEGNMEGSCRRNIIGCARNDGAQATPCRLPPGLKLKPGVNRQTDADFLAAAVKAGKASQLPSLLDSARRRAAIVVANDPVALESATCDLLLVSLRACAASRYFEHGIVAYDHVSNLIGNGTGELWSVLLYNVVEAKAFHRCQPVFEKLCSLGTFSAHDLVNVVRCYAGIHDPSGLELVVAQLHKDGHKIDAYTLNRALAACVNSSEYLHLAEILVSSSICCEGLDSVGYNTLMKFNAKFGRLKRCFELRSEMLDKGLEMSEVTYGILLDACVGSKEIKCAKKIFNDLCSSGLQLNVVHCTTFLKGLVSTGHHDEAARVLREMSRSAGVKPDLITYSTIVKAYSESGNVRSALDLLEQMIQEGIRPDDIMYNSVLNACNAFPLQSSEVMCIFDTIVGYGMVPTTTTLSILLKALMLSDSHIVAFQVLETATKKFKVVPEIRLYMQVTQACIKARKHRATIEVFEAMLKVARGRDEKIEASDLTRLLRSCAHGGDSHLAVEMQRCLHNAGIPLDPSAEKIVKASISKSSRRG